LYRNCLILKQKRLWLTELATWPVTVIPTFLAIRRTFFVRLWLLAIAGWALVSACGSDDPKGSRRYEVEPSSEQQTKESKQQASTNAGSEDPKPSEQPTKPAKKPTHESSAIKIPGKAPNPLDVPTTPATVHWNLDGIGTAVHASVTSISKSEAEITVYNNKDKIWTAAKVPYQTALSQPGYAEYNLGQTTWTWTKQEVTFWIKPKTQECQLHWLVDSWTSEKAVVLQGKCALVP
jgi:hypothetical protein